MSVRRVLILGAAASLAVGALVAVASSAGAATFTPTPDPTVDGAAGSLRAAVVAATNAGGDEIDLAAGGTYTLTCAGGGELFHANTPLILSTPSGAPATIRQICANSRVLGEGTGPLTLNNVIITGGTQVPGNGGGVIASGAVTVTNSTISGNTAAGSGGGIATNAGAVTVTNSTISGNTATTGSGGGIDAAGSVTLTNSTISANTAATSGGGVFAVGSVTLVYATVVQNSAPATTGANVDASGLTSFGSVVAQARGGGANCDLVSTTSNGFNFSDDASAGVSCHFNAATDRVGASNDPMLGALGANGGPTNTMVPNPGSPLIDAIPNASCTSDGASGISTDQRGFTRPQVAGGLCDIGAVEVQPALAPVAPVVITPRFTG